MFKLTTAKGFTLVELLLVITLTVAIMAMVAPNLSSGNQSSMLKGAARDLASGLRFARGQALKTQQDTALSIDLEQNSYQVTGQEKTYQLPHDIDITLAIAQSEAESSGTGSIRYFPDGSSSGGRITLELGDLKQTVDVNWLTGQIELNAE
ncbi:MAG: GspH/FimT family pseudopilin [Methylococcaceae bacterium]